VCTFHKLVRISRVQFRVKWIHLLALAARAISPANRSDLIPGLTLAIRTTKPRTTASAASSIDDGRQCDDESGCKSENDLSHIVPRVDSRVWCSVALLSCWDLLPPAKYLFVAAKVVGSTQGIRIAVINAGDAAFRRHARRSRVYAGDEPRMR
jgi:hypothetical protein